jgi:hypothetical protein
MNWEVILKDSVKHESIEAMDKLAENLQEAMFSYSKLSQSISQENQDMFIIEMGDMANALLDAIRARGNLHRAFFKQEEMA